MRIRTPLSYYWCGETSGETICRSTQPRLITTQVHLLHCIFYKSSMLLHTQSTDLSTLILPSHSNCCRIHCSYLPLQIAPPCHQSEVRIVVRNRVQVCHNETWGYVCAERSIDRSNSVCEDRTTGWNDNAAAVVCKALGFSQG